MLSMRAPHLLSGSPSSEQTSSKGAVSKFPSGQQPSSDPFVQPYGLPPSCMPTL